ncbi:MAG: glycerol-3-phosphate dehydrogenase/oxidase [Parachlamydiaceae bacterium]
MTAGDAAPYDLVVIGGGINGAAIARDAAMRGLSVVLLEKEDFGYGASTKTSKLAHGGIRYLEQLQFSLVRESLRERALLMKNAPHLVHPLPFIYPVYDADARPLWQIHLGLFLYDFLGGWGTFPRHRKLSVEEIVKQFPGIRSEGLQGGCLYYDAQMLDHRIVIENIIAAERSGALIHNYAEVLAITVSKLNDRVNGVRFCHRETGLIETIPCRSVVNATGAWSEQLAAMTLGTLNKRTCHVAPTKGVHMIIPQVADGTAIVLHTPQDKRVFFVIPWEKNSLVGTTDTFYEGNPDAVAVEKVDCNYLLTAVQAYFPQLQPTVLASFAGLRPLVAPVKGNASPSDIIREHVVETSPEGITTILGGKFTTHRCIAESVVDKVVNDLKVKKQCRPCETATIPLPGANMTIKSQLQATNLGAEVVEHLVSTYGALSTLILEILEINPTAAHRICDGHPHIVAELIYVVKYEHVKTIGDWLHRRTSIATTPPCCGQRCLEATADILAILLGWSQERKSHEMTLNLQMPV